MKSGFFLLFICVAALSCKGERVEKRDEGSESRITFSTQFTRGTVMEDSTGLAAQGGFNVWAASHNTPWASMPTPTRETLLDNVKVTGTVSGDGIIWSYASAAKWPANNYVSFFAYGPSGSATVAGNSAAGSPTLEFQVNPNVQEQVDFVIARPVYDQMGMTYSGSKPVRLFFNHALSRIVLSGVQVNADSDTRDISVKSVTLNGLYFKGTADLGTTTPTWDVDQTETASYTLSTDGGELNNTPLSSAAAKLTTDAGYMFLMPQVMARDNGLDPTMDVTLTIDGDENVHTSVMFSPTEWLPGKSYDYHLVVDGDDLKLVLVDVTDLELTEWRVEIMMQPVPLSNSVGRDTNRIYSALASFGHLNLDEDNNIPSPDPCNYFAIYLMNKVRHDITISMDGYEPMFTEGEYVIFDCRKVVESWDTNPETGNGYAFTVNYDPTYWTLEPAIQNVTDPVDASSGATVTGDALTNSITTYGSVIVRRTSAPAPVTP